MFFRKKEDVIPESGELPLPYKKAVLSDICLVSSFIYRLEEPKKVDKKDIDYMYYSVMSIIKKYRLKFKLNMSISKYEFLVDCDTLQLVFEELSNELI